MKIKELMKILEKYDPEKYVIVALFPLPYKGTLVKHATILEVAETCDNGGNLQIDIDLEQT